MDKFRVGDKVLCSFESDALEDTEPDDNILKYHDSEIPATVKSIAEGSSMYKYGLVEVDMICKESELTLHSRYHKPVVIIHEA